jgi:hypothetical protein
MEIALKIIGPVVTLLICLAGALIAVGRIKQMVAQNELSTQSTRKEIEAIHSKLALVVMKGDCEKQSDKCRIALCSKINEVKDRVAEVKDLVIELHEKQSSKIDKLDEKREAAKDLYAKDFNKIIAFMSRVEQLLKNERYVTSNRITEDVQL